MDAPRPDAGQRLQILDHRSERVAVIRIAVQRLVMEDELAAFGRGHRGGDRDLAAELIGRLRLAS